MFLKPKPSFGEREPDCLVLGSVSLTETTPSSNSFPHGHRAIQAIIYVGNKPYRENIDTGATRSLVRDEVLYDYHLIRHGDNHFFGNTIK